MGYRFVVLFLIGLGLTNNVYSAGRKQLPCVAALSLVKLAQNGSRTLGPFHNFNLRAAAKGNWVYSQQEMIAKAGNANRADLKTATLVRLKNALAKAVRDRQTLVTTDLGFNERSSEIWKPETGKTLGLAQEQLRVRRAVINFLEKNELVYKFVDEPVTEPVSIHVPPEEIGVSYHPAVLYHRYSLKIEWNDSIREAGASLVGIDEL